MYTYTKSYNSKYPVTLTWVKFSSLLHAIVRKTGTLLTHKNQKKKMRKFVQSHKTVNTFSHVCRCHELTFERQKKKKKERYKGRHRCKSHIKGWSACIAKVMPHLRFSSAVITLLTLHSLKFEPGRSKCLAWT